MKVFASSTCTRTFGRSRALWFHSLNQPRAARTTWGSISTASTETPGCMATAPTEVPLPTPTTIARRAGPGKRSAGR